MNTERAAEGALATLRGDLADPASACPGLFPAGSGGNSRQLPSLRGNFVLLHFWANCRLLRRPAALLAKATGKLTSADNFTSCASISTIPRNGRRSALRPRTDCRCQCFWRPKSPAFTISFTATCSIGAEIWRYQPHSPESRRHDRKGVSRAAAARTSAEDVRSVPETPADFLRKALPMRGQLLHEEFQRNDLTYGVAMFQRGYLEEASGRIQASYSGETRRSHGLLQPRHPLPATKLAAGGATLSRTGGEIALRLCGSLEQSRDGVRATRPGGRGYRQFSKALFSSGRPTSPHS